MKTDNELIAEFMGIIQHPTNPKRYYHKGGPTTENYGLDELGYEWSWDWLMPVVEKIYKTDYPLPQTKVSAIEGALTTARIESVYAAVVEFVKWYSAKLGKV